MFISFWLFISALAARGQVSELWSRGLTNTSVWCEQLLGPCDIPETNYFVTRLEVDPIGNSFLGGYLSRGWAMYSPFVAKFDSNGELAWLRDLLSSDETDRFGIPLAGVEGIVVNERGDVFATARFRADSVDGPITVLLSKISGANGDLIWEKPVASSFSNTSSCSGIRSDSRGNIALLAMERVMDRRGRSKTSLAVSKITSAGRTLWKCVVPASGFLLPEHGIRDSLAISRTDAVVVAGARSADAVAARIDARGRLDWWTTRSRASHPLHYYATAMVGVNESFCVSGSDGATVFHRSGRPVRSESEFGGLLVGKFNDGGYLLANGAAFQKLSAAGRVQYRVPGGGNPLFHLIGAATDPEGFVAAGAATGQTLLEGNVPTVALCFVRFDRKGNLVWRYFDRSKLVDTSYPQSLSPNGLRRQSDGSYVVSFHSLGTFSRKTGVSVVAIRVE